jgi:hypothetical protein
VKFNAPFPKLLAIGDDPVIPIDEFVERQQALDRGRRAVWTAARRAKLAQRMAKWADAKKIAAFYAEAARLTRETGIQHDVDHIIPLHGEAVSGLHVETNLQVLPATANRAKKNDYGF